MKLEPVISEEIFTEFRQFITYGIEDTYTTQSNEFELGLRNSFFSELYYNRPYCEDKIGAWIKSSGGDLGIVVGVQGVGKSTVLKKIEQHLDHESYPVFSINFKNFFEEQLENKDASLWKTLIDEHLKGALANRYFKEDRIDKFIPFFLYEDASQEIFHRERNKIHRIYKSLVYSSQTELNEYQWFKDNMHHPDVVPVLQEVEGKIALKHYLIASRIQSNNSIKTFVVVFDNVDRVPKGFQCRIYQIAEDLRAIHKTSANIVIATRKETCYPPEEVCNLNPAPIAEFGIYSSVESDKNKLSSEDFFNILSRRLNSFLVYAKDNAAAKTLVDISQALRGEYAEAYLINLANQSVREALKYHCEFVGYLLSHYKAEDLIKFIKNGFGGSFLLSCLYGWLTGYSHVLNRKCVNVFELLSECKTKEYRNIKGCDLTYLILVCLYNFRRRNDRNPSVEELFKCFKPLSYTEEKLRFALFDLWQLSKDDFGHIVSIYQYPLPKNPREIDLSVETEINYRGEALIKRVSVSFTFINHLLFRSNNNFFYSLKEKAKIAQYHDIENIPIHANYNIKFFFNLAFLHSLELHKIRTRLNRDDWYELYARNFCIDKKLQLTRILRSNIGFLKRVIEENQTHLSQSKINILEASIEQMNFLDELYALQVNNFTLDNISDLSILDFSKIFDVITNDTSLISNSIAFLSKREYKRDIGELL